MGVANRSPLLQRTVHTNSVVVDLVTTTDHNMERLPSVDPQHVIPEAGTNPGIHVRPDGEAIAGVEHLAHGLVRRGNDEVPGRIDGTSPHVLQTRDIVFPTRLIGLDWDGNGEPPESLPRVFVESQSVNHDPLLGVIDLRIVISHRTSLAQV